MSREHTIAIPADGSDPEDRPVSQAALERAQMGRRIRRLRTGRRSSMPLCHAPPRRPAVRQNPILVVGRCLCGSARVWVVWQGQTAA